MTLSGFATPAGPAQASAPRPLTDWVTLLSSRTPIILMMASVHPSTVVSPTLSVVPTLVGKSLSATVTITGTQGLAGTLWWNVHGPVAPGGDGTCATATWTVSSTPNATIPVPHDQVVNIPAISLPAAGCYSYSLTLVGPYTTQTTVQPGQGSPATLFQVTPQLSVTPRLVGRSLSATASVTGTIGLAGTLWWNVHGPAAPVDGSCASAVWSISSTPNQIIAIKASGPVSIPATTLPGAGCYAYSLTVLGPYSSSPSLHPGSGSPPVLLAINPSLSGRTVTVANGSVHGGIGVTGTLGVGGELDWFLAGPVTAGPSGTCSDADWSSAPLIKWGSVMVTGDGVATTQDEPVTVPGCYSYLAILRSADYTTWPSLGLGPSNATGLLRATPVVGMTVDRKGGTATGSVEVVGTAGVASTVSWRLVGPVAAPRSGRCTNVSFAGAPTIASGSKDLVGDATVSTAAEPIAAASSCYSFTATVRAPQLAASVSVPAGRADAVVSSTSPLLSGVFVSPTYINSWSTAKATTALTNMKAIGLTTVVLQNAAGIIDGSGSTPDQVLTAYPAPSSEPPSPGYGIASFGSATVKRSSAYSPDLQLVSPSNDEVTTLLDAGVATGERVLLGLTNGQGVYDEPTTVTQTTCVIAPTCPPTTWMRNQVAYAEQVALEMAAMATSKSSFGGWYLPLEFESAAWTSPAARSDLAYFDGQISDFLAQLTPGKSIIVSPYIDQIATSRTLPASPSCPWGSQVDAGQAVIPAFDTPCGFMGDVTALLEHSSITGVWLQDGLGDVKTAPYETMTEAEIPAWQSAIVMAAEAASAATKRTIFTGAVLDLYTTANTPISSASLAENLGELSTSAGTLAGYSWSQLDPSVSANLATWTAFKKLITSLHRR